MIDRSEANDWIERMMDGEDIPSDVEEYIQNHPECREFQAALERAVSALDALQIPDPPADLNDRVMSFIAEQESDQPTFAEPERQKPRQSIWLDVWHAALDLLPEIQIPQILHKEGFPAFVTVCVIFFGIFIAPQVQAGKDSRLFARVNTYADWMAEESDRISDGIYSKANGLINRVTEVFQRSERLIPSETMIDINESNPSYKKDTDDTAANADSNDTKTAESANGVEK